MDDIYEDFWGAFLEETGTPENTYLQNYTYFGGDEERSVQILEQLLSGEKTAVSHCVPVYLATRQRMPQAGDYTLVTDFYGNPCCILHTEGVDIVPLPEITAEQAARDVPGQALDDWLRDRQEEYADLAGRFGFHYSEELPVLMETVTRVYPVAENGTKD